MHHKRINVSIVLAAQHAGIKEVDDRVWIVSLMRFDLGSIDVEQCPSGVRQQN